MSEPPSKPFKAGTSYVAPKLYRFDGNSQSWKITVIRPWPSPQAWQRSDQAPWRACRPRVDVSLPDRRLKGRASWRSRKERVAFEQVPQQVRELVGGLSPHLQWAVLSMIARVDGAAELMSSAPTLGVALAHCHRFRPGVKRRLRKIRVRVSMRRRRILEWLGFPDRESSVRAVAKVDRPAPFALLHLRWLLNEGDPWVFHLPVLRREVLELMAVEPEHRKRLTFGILEEITAMREARERLRNAMMVGYVARWEPTAPRRIPKLRSLAQAKELYQELVQHEEHQRLQRMLARGPFPDPPYAAQALGGSRSVRLRPIAGARELVAHANKQHNCMAAGDYLDRVHKGTGYAYELTWPESKDQVRTASLYVEAKGLLHRTWGIDDLQLSLNREAPSWLADEVRRFLARVPADRDPAKEVERVDEREAEPDDRQLELPFWDDSLPF